MKLYGMNLTKEMLDESIKEFDKLRGDGYNEYKIWYKELICWDVELFILDEDSDEYQQIVLDWVFDEKNYEKTLPIIVYHCLPFESRELIRQYYCRRMRYDGIDVEWDVIKSGEDLEKWINDEDTLSDLYPLWNSDWKLCYDELGLNDCVGVFLDIFGVDPSIRQLLLQVDAL